MQRLSGRLSPVRLDHAVRSGACAGSRERLSVRQPSSIYMQNKMLTTRLQDGQPLREHLVRILITVTPQQVLRRGGSFRENAMTCMSPRLSHQESGKMRDLCRCAAWRTNSYTSETQMCLVPNVHGPHLRCLRLLEDSAFHRPRPTGCAPSTRLVKYGTLGGVLRKDAACPSSVPSLRRPVGFSREGQNPALIHTHNLCC